MNKHIGSTFDDFLEKEEIREEVENTAIKKIIALGMQNEMTEKAANVLGKKLVLRMM